MFTYTVGIVHINRLPIFENMHYKLAMGVATGLNVSKIN